MSRGINKVILVGNLGNDFSETAAEIRRVIAALRQRVEASVPDDVQLALDHSRNFATAKPNIGSTEKEHILGLCNLLERQFLKTPEWSLDVDALAQEIRRVDGNHKLGAGALAEALMPFLVSRAAPAAGEGGGDG